MISATEAARIVIDNVPRLPFECIPLPEALDRVLATDAKSPLDLPPWNNSAMDGYAVRSADLTAGRPDGQMTGDAVHLEVVEAIPAGGFPTKPLEPGECARIFTGAPLPKNADGVIRQEDTTPLDGGHVRIDNPRDAGRNVRFKGEDIRRGSVVLGAGTPLGPAALGVLASIAEGEVYVYRQPRVGLLGSGDEIVDLDARDEIIRGTKIASSNTYTMTAMTQRAGGEPVQLGVARDDPQDLRARLLHPVAMDMLVTSGGISVGEHDHMRSVLEELDTDIKFWKIRMRPGAPVAFGLMGATPWIGLPGNPVSTMVTFELFVRPAIRKMLGYTKVFRRTVTVRVGEAFTLRPKLTHFQRVVLTDEDGEPTARLTGPQGSGILTSMADADALLIVPPEVEDVQVGDHLKAIVLDDPVHVEEPDWEDK